MPPNGIKLRAALIKLRFSADAKIPGRNGSLSKVQCRRKNCNNKLFKGNKLDSCAKSTKADQWELDNEDEQRNAILL